MDPQIREAANPEDLASLRELLREYAEWVGGEICFQSFECELADLPGRYAPPSGRLFLASVGGEPAGCAALRALDSKAGEIKRMYVRPGFRGLGVGRLLVARIVEDAQDAGYKVLRLDTLPRMSAAIAMYRALGFYEIPRYGDHPGEAVCFELRLNGCLCLQKTSRFFI